MDLKEHKNNVEQWFLTLNPSLFPNSVDYVSTYKTIVTTLAPIHTQVNAGADFTDQSTLTRHDKSHIYKVIKQISQLLSYKNATLTPFECFNLLVAIQIHDIKNIEGREDHENNAIEIFNDLDIKGIIDSRELKNIGFIASCHSGSFMRNEEKETDKIGFLLQPYEYLDVAKIRPQYLAALLRLADEYADDIERAMTYLLKINKVQEASIIHQKHAESLRAVSIQPDTGIVELDYYLTKDNAIQTFPKYLKDSGTWENRFLLDEIFARTVKTHYETIYCMRFLRPDISINKIKVAIEVERKALTEKRLIINYEMIEKGYPNNSLDIIGLCGESIRKNGGYWNGQNLRDYLADVH